MNTIESYEGTNPDGQLDTMCKIHMDSNGILRLSQCIQSIGEYTLQFWIKNSEAITLEASGLYDAISVNDDWRKYVFTFRVTNRTNDSITFNLPAGDYYLYKAKLEAGGVATEYTEYMEDSEEDTPYAQLYRLSDKYTDKIGCNNSTWYIEHNTELINLDGSESWTLNGSTFTYTIPLRGNAYASLPVMSDTFDDVTVTNTEDNTLISITTDVASSVSDFNTYLADVKPKILIPAKTVTIPLANYLQSSLNSVMANGTLNVSFNDTHVNSIRAHALIKPIIVGKLNEDMSVLINNVSDDDIDFIYQVHCTDVVVNPLIYHTESNRYIKINSTFKANDVITITSKRGKKSVTKTYQGDEINIINDLDVSSKWFTLKSGYNHISQSADSGVKNMDSVIVYTNEYEGV